MTLSRWLSICWIVGVLASLLIGWISCPPGGLRSSRPACVSGSWLDYLLSPAPTCVTAAKFGLRHMACRFLGPPFFSDTCSQMRNCQQKFGHPKLQQGIALGWIGPGDPYFGQFASIERTPSPWWQPAGDGVCGCVWVVWSGLVWSGLVWSGLVWSGLVWTDVGFDFVVMCTHMNSLMVW